MAETVNLILVMSGVIFGVFFGFLWEGSFFAGLFWVSLGSLVLSFTILMLAEVFYRVC